MAIKARYVIAILVSLAVIVGGVCFYLLPPSIEFGDPVFSVRVMPDGERLLNASIPVDNTSQFSVRFRNAGNNDAWALGAVKKPNNESRLSSAKWAPWTELKSNESVLLRVFSLDPEDEIGIQLKDWMGRLHVIFSSNLNVKEAWDRRDKLPVDDSG